MASTHLDCLICGKPVVLVPSAAERAAADKTGRSADYYRRLFPEHSECQLQRRQAETAELMRRISAKS